jgi:hypothetical protein
MVTTTRTPRTCGPGKSPRRSPHARSRRIADPREARWAVLEAVYPESVYGVVAERLLATLQARPRHG